MLSAAARKEPTTLAEGNALTLEAEPYAPGAQHVSSRCKCGADAARAARGAAFPARSRDFVTLGNVAAYGVPGGRCCHDSYLSCSVDLEDVKHTLGRVSVSSTIVLLTRKPCEFVGGDHAAFVISVEILHNRQVELY